MSSTSTMIPTEEAVAGMIVASDLKDANGGVMVAGGSELTPRLIEVLKLRQIVEIEIVVGSDEPQGESRRSRVMAKLEQQYAVHKDDPVMQQLRSLFESYHTRGLK